MLMVTVHGGDGSGKGHLMALITKCLRDKGLTVSLQCEETHNKEKMLSPVENHVDRLSNVNISITELQVYEKTDSK